MASWDVLSPTPKTYNSVKKSHSPIKTTISQAKPLFSCSTTKPPLWNSISPNPQPSNTPSAFYLESSTTLSKKSTKILSPEPTKDLMVEKGLLESSKKASEKEFKTKEETKDGLIEPENREITKKDNPENPEKDQEISEGPTTTGTTITTIMTKEEGATITGAMTTDVMTTSEIPTTRILSSTTDRAISHSSKSKGSTRGKIQITKDKITKCQINHIKTITTTGMAETIHIREVGTTITVAIEHFLIIFVYDCVLFDLGYY
jgi:hypothetical protein